MSATPFGQNWPTTWTYDGTFVSGGLAVAAGTTTTSSTVISNSGASPNEVLDTEVTVAVTYGGTITGGGATISICRRTLTGFQSPAVDAPYGVTQIATASSTVNTTLMVRGFDIADFEVAVNNPTGNSSITVKVGYRQSQGQSG